MSSISALQSGLMGIQFGLSNLNKNAEKIASASMSPNSQTEDITKPLIDMQVNKLQISASAQVVKTMNETLGTIIDIFA